MSNQPKPFGTKDKLAYMSGDIANDFTFLMASFFLMLFYTNVLEIPGYIVGILFLISRVIDAFTDIGMGRLLDTMNPFPEGRFRGMIKRASPFVCIIGFLLFLYIVKDWSYPAKLIYISVTYILWGSFAYTAVNIPYGSMATVISAKPEDRSALSIFRTMGSNIAALIIQFLVPLLIYTQIEGKQVIQPEMFSIVMFVFAILAFVFYQLCWKNSTERVVIANKATTKHARENCLKDLKEIFSSLSTNKPLISFIFVAIILLLIYLLIGSMNPYLYIDYFNSKVGLSVGGIIPVLTTFVVAPFAQIFVKRFGKKESSAIALLSTGIIYLILYFLGVKDVWVYVVIITIAYLGFNYFMVIIWAFITDIIDNQYLQTNRREDGTIYAVYSFARKIGQALAGGLGGITLSLVHYVPNAPQQTQTTLDSIYSVATLVPGIGCIIIFLILQFLYPLSKNVVNKNTEKLVSMNSQQ